MRKKERIIRTRRVIHYKPIYMSEGERCTRWLEKPSPTRNQAVSNRAAMDLEVRLEKELAECDADLIRIRPLALSPVKIAQYARAADQGLHGQFLDEEERTDAATATASKQRAKTPPSPKKKIKRPVRLDATKHEAQLQEVLGRELRPSERMETKEVFCLSETAGQPAAVLSVAYGKALLQRAGRLSIPTGGKGAKSTKVGGIPPAST